MSWKIYNAYEWTGSLELLLKILREIREEHWTHSRGVLMSNLDKEKFWARFTEYQNALKKALSSMEHEQFHDRFGIIENVAASAVVTPWRGRLFVQFFGLDRHVRRGMRHRKLKDFHWQNSSDCPPEVKAKAWAEREGVWKSIFEKDGRPSRAGLVFEMLDESDGYRMAGEILDRFHGHGRYNVPKEVTDACEACKKTSAAWKLIEAEKDAN